MGDELTQLSDTDLDHILYGHMSPKMAADFLREERISLRGFSQTLAVMCPAGDLLQRLTEFYQMVEPDSNQQSITKKISNWLAGRNQPTNREDFFRIAFALRLSEAQLDFLLGLCTDYGIQYRDSREVVLAWFLRNGYGYQEGIEFLSSLPAPTEGPEPRPGMHSRITHELQNEFQLAQSLDEVRACYRKNLGRFGKLHLRSYHYFEQYLDQLIHPVSALGGSEPDYSIEAVTDTYLSLQMPSGRKRTNYSLVQKLIKSNWPNATAIKNIRNRAEDVPRKVLLLLYVVTENAGLGDEYRELDEDYISLEERVQDHWWTINAMLTDCGMALLDPRNAFDWLILYSICAGPEEAMSDRLEAVISELFGDIKKSMEGEKS